MSGWGLWYNTDEDAGYRDPSLYCYLPARPARGRHPSPDWIERSWGHDEHFRRQRDKRVRPIWGETVDPFEREIMARLLRAKPGENP